MARRVFFSFHFDNDCWRTQQVRNINAIEGQPICSPNAWEDVKRKGDASIKNWIATNMEGKSCIVVLVGEETANRPWVRHEISKAWNDGRGVLGIRVNKLLDSYQKPSAAGPDPFSKITFTGTSKTLSGIAPLKTPTGAGDKGQPPG